MPSTSQLPSWLGSRGSLSILYGDVAEAAPNALIVVTGYPLLFEIVPEDPAAAIKVQINNAITPQQHHPASCRNCRGRCVNIVYVDVTAEFAGHGIGSKKPFINSNGADAYHPNVAGYRTYAKAIFAAIRSAWLDDNMQVA